ncbi:MAG TPA: ABC transporter ATP-binding protein [Bacteroidales bacterium]|nr:ABC transporter ATP-binding protein [Bacteroidales bacterium]
MTAQPIIAIRDLTKVYKGADSPAVSALSLDIYPEEVFGLLGPNGAGKTTTISILCGLFRATSGTVTIDGIESPSGLDRIKRIIGVVPQDIALYPTLTGRENLTFFGNMYGLQGPALRNKIDGYLHEFGLEKHADRLVSKYSGGMKRRVNLIAGLLHDPKILFLDEPTVGIDVQSRVVILEYLRELNRKGVTIIYTSHYMEEAESLCSRVAIIDRGNIIALGQPRELLKEHPEYQNLENIFLHLTGKGLRDG